MYQKPTYIHNCNQAHTLILSFPDVLAKKETGQALWLLSSHQDKQLFPRPNS